METRVNATSLDAQGEVYAGDKALTITDRDMPFHRPLVKELEDSDLSLENVLDIREPGKKFLVSSNVGVYNFFYAVLSSIIRIHRHNPDATFIIEPHQVVHNADNKHFVKTFSSVLTYKGIKHKILDVDNYDTLIVNDFVLVPPGTINFNHTDVEDAAEACRSVSGISAGHTGNKKVYVSRKNVVDDRSFVGLVKPGLSFDKDFRIFNEHILEDFLRSIGFEVVYPEDFQSMEDQIRYFSEVEVLVSVTSSGIANAMFMKPGGAIVELTTTFLMMMSYEEAGMPPYEAYESIHHIYNNLAYVVGHNHFTIPNYTRQAEDIRDRIINNKYLKELFNLGD
jgi:hypothetical protein